MRLGLVIFRCFPHGGLQRDFLRLAQRLIDRGHWVELLTGEWSGPRPSGVPICRFPSRGHTNHGRNRSVAEQVLAAAPALGYDALVGFNRMPGLDIYYCGDSCFRADTDRRGLLTRLTPRYRQMAADEAAVFAPGSRTQVLMLSPKEPARYAAVYGTEDERLHPVPPMIGRDRQRPPEAVVRERRQAFRHSLGIAEDQLLVLSIGAAARTKGVDRTIRAIGRLPRCVRRKTWLAIMGAGEGGTIRGLARRHGVAGRVLALGPREDVPDALAAADVLAHPARRENTGQALLEAVVAGVPVIATENCGYSDHVRAAAAGRILSHPFRAGDYVDALAEMLASPEQRAAWSANGTRYGQTHNLYDGLDHAAALIERFVGRSRRGAAA